MVYVRIASQCVTKVLNALDRKLHLSLPSHLFQTEEFPIVNSEAVSVTPSKHILRDGDPYTAESALSSTAVLTFSEDGVSTVRDWLKFALTPIRYMSNWGQLVVSIT
jgi:hypothetical protein